MSASPFDACFVDLYAPDLYKDWVKYCAAGAPWMGAVFKVSQGVGYSDDTWLKHEVTAAKAAMGLEYGQGYLVGGYHYWTAKDDPKTQAERFIKHAEFAGLGHKDLWPVVDVESANNGNPSGQQIVDGVSTYTERMAELGYKTMILYGASFLYDHGVTSRMGCKWIWPARYTATFPENVLTRIGWSEDAFLAWQIRGDDNNAQLKNKAGQLYPDSAPGIGKTDISVLTFPGGLPALTAAVAA